MLEGLLDNLKGEIGGELMEKFGLDSSQKDKAIDITKETITETVQKETAGGNGLSGLMNLFSSDDNNEEGNSMMDNIGGMLSSKFSSQLGIDSEKSGGIKDMIMSKVIGMFGSKLGSNFEISDLLGLVGGGDSKGGGLGGMLGKLGGLFGK